MRFSLLFTLFASTALVFGSASPGLASRELDELIARNDGDVSLLLSRDFQPSEVLERDAALSSREFSDDEIHQIALRHLGVEERDLIELEPRFVAVLARVAQGIVRIVRLIKGEIEKDKKRRGQFTSNLIAKSRAKFPGYNWVICHTKHTYKFNGQRGKDWGHRHQEFDVKIGGTIGYEIYYFKSGTFTRRGDGGYLNWAYGGRIKSKSKDGKTITFA